MRMKMPTHLLTPLKLWQWPVPRPVSSQAKLLADLNGLRLLTIQEMNETLQIATPKCREEPPPNGDLPPLRLKRRLADRRAPAVALRRAR